MNRIRWEFVAQFPESSTFTSSLDWLIARRTPNMGTHFLVPEEAFEVPPSITSGVVVPARDPSAGNLQGIPRRDAHWFCL